MEDDLEIYFFKWKTTSKKMEDNLKKRDERRTQAQLKMNLNWL